MPAAPSVWPVKPLVELAWVARREAPRHQRRLDLVVLGAGRAVQVDVVDRRSRRCRRGPARRRARARRRGLRDAASTCGARRSIRRSRAGRGRRRPAPSARSSRAKPAASPMLMPLRSASNGRHGSGETSCSALKPNRTLPHSVSTPPTIAASARPSRSIRSALANTLALDEQAVETVTLGPSRSSASWTKRVERMRRVHLRVAVARRKAAFAVERAVRVFGGADARGRGAEHERDPGRAVALARGMGGVDEVVGDAGRARRAGCCGTPSAASGWGSGLRLDAGDAADPGGERARTEVVGAQRRLAGAQGREQRGLAGAGRGRRRVGRDPERGETRRRHGR